MAWFEQSSNFSHYAHFYIYEHVSCEFLQGYKFNDWTGWTIKVQSDRAARALCDFILKEAKQQEYFIFQYI